MGEPKPMLHIIRDAWARSGGSGKMPREYVREWLAAHPLYARWPLWVRFHSGSAVPVMGDSEMSRIMAAWIAAGHPRPGQSGFSWSDWQAFADGYTDEYDKYEDREGKVIGLAVENGEIVKLTR